MTVFVEFDLDTRTEEISNLKIVSPYSEVEGARTDVSDKVEGASRGGGSSLMEFRCADTGEYHFVNVMKVADIRVYEQE